MKSPVSDYAEIGITTNFSFLRGGSDPRAYVHQASLLGIPAIGIADRNTLAGVVRAYKELENPEVTHKPKLLIGARIVFIDGTPDILVYPRDRAAYGRLCQLLTRGKRGDDITRIEKGECHLRFDDLLEFAEGQLLVLALPHRFDAAERTKILARLKTAAPMASGLPQACSIAATTSAGWRGCIVLRSRQRCRCWRPTRCCTTIPPAARCRTC